MGVTLPTLDIFINFSTKTKLKKQKHNNKKTKQKNKTKQNQQIKKRFFFTFFSQKPVIK